MTPLFVLKSREAEQPVQFRRLHTLQVKSENTYLTAHVDMLQQQHQQSTHVLYTPLTALVTTKCNSPSQMSISESASNTRVATQKRSHSATPDDASVVPTLKARKINSDTPMHWNISTRPVAAANAQPACSVQTNGSESEQTIQTVTSSAVATLIIAAGTN